MTSTHSVLTFDFVGHILQSAYVTWVEAYHMVETAAALALQATTAIHYIAVSVKQSIQIPASR